VSNLTGAAVRNGPGSVLADSDLRFGL